MYTQQQKRARLEQTLSQDMPHSRNSIMMVEDIKCAVYSRYRPPTVEALHCSSTMGSARSNIRSTTRSACT
jgi:hypothetical protein